MPFRQWLMAGASSTVVALVTTSGLGAKRDEDGDRADADEDNIGKLTVRKLSLLLSPIAAVKCIHT